MTGKALAERLCRKFPEAPSLTLARRLYSENQEKFLNLDAARSAIRHVRGAKGKDKAHTATVPRPLGKPYNPLGLPKSDEQDWTPFIIEDPRTMGVIGDIHLPYHNLAALTAALQTLKKRKITTLLINGDLVDYHSLSRFVRDPKARSIGEERDATLQFFKVVRRMFPNVRIIWKLGNHEERQDIYLTLKAPELLDLPEFRYENFFKLADYGVELVKDKRIIHAGKLPVIHGHEYPTPVLGPVNAARGLFLRAKSSALVNHHHQVSEHSECDIKGNLITCWSLGCLCELHPAYARLNKWSHGFAIVSVDGAGNFEVENKRIIGGRVV